MTAQLKINMHAPSISRWSSAESDLDLKSDMMSSVGQSREVKRMRAQLDRIIADKTAEHEEQLLETTEDYEAKLMFAEIERDRLNAEIQRLKEFIYATRSPTPTLSMVQSPTPSMAQTRSQTPVLSLENALCDVPSGVEVEDTLSTPKILANALLYALPADTEIDDLTSIASSEQSQSLPLPQMPPKMAKKKQTRQRKEKSSIWDAFVRCIGPSMDDDF